MKNILNINWLLNFFLALVASVLLLSCDENENGAAPVLDRVSLVPKDSTTNEGLRGNTYVIFGNNLATAQAVYFNGEQAPLNTTLVRNDNIIIRIGDNTPYVNAMNKVRVVTKYGEASMEFVVKQKPVIENFSPAVAGPGEIVTIRGDYFLGLQSVVFIDQKTLAETEAEIVSSSVDEIQVKVPEGTKVSFIKVTTPGGVVQSSSTFGFNYIIYADQFNPSWENWSWSSEFDYNSSNVVKSGEYSYKQTYTGGWGGVQLSGGGLPLKEGDQMLYEALKMSIYGGPGTEGKELIVTINWAVQIRITLREGKWTDFTLPLSDFGNPAQLDVLVLQDVGNVGATAPYLMYIDDMGLI